MTDSPQSSAAPATSPQVTRSPLNNTVNGVNSAPGNPNAGNNSPAQLATMLANSFREVEGLRRDLSIMRRRAEKAERLLAAISAPMSATSGPGSSPTASGSGPTPTTPSQALPDSAIKQIINLEKEKDQAELERDEALARLRVVSESWQELDRYLSVVDLRASDARAGFARIVADGGGQLVLAPIPVPGQTPASAYPPHMFPQSQPPLTLMPPQPPRHHGSSRGLPLTHRNTVSHTPQAFPQTLPLPPPPNPNPSSTGRRPRAGSLDGAGYPAPPTKRHRSGRDRTRDSFIDSPMNSPHAHHPQAPPTAGSPYPSNPGAPTYAPSDPHRSHRYESERRHRLHTHPHQQHHLPPYPGRGRTLSRSPASSRSSSKSLDEMLLETATDPTRSPDFRRPGMVGPGVLAPQGQMQTFNTHTFAPVVTGAPVKKSKGPPINGSGSVMTLGPNGSVISGPSGVASGGYPPTNAAGQRICRQCGLPGRYKDGKCVEKWGPGPDGPGTVCDRCRKKMKRVERRNTAADSSQHLPGNFGPPIHHRSLPEHPSLHGSFRGSHLQAAHSSQDPDRPIQRTDTLIMHHTPPPPPPGIQHIPAPGPSIQRDRDEHVRPSSSHVSVQGSVQDRRDFPRSPQPPYPDHRDRDRRSKDPRDVEIAAARSHSNSLSNGVLSGGPSSTSNSPAGHTARQSPAPERPSSSQLVDVDADADADADGEAEL